MANFQVTHLDWDAALVRAFEPAASASVMGQGTVLEMFQGCHAFEFVEGARRALLAVHPLQREAGNILEVCALVSTGERIGAEALDTALGHIAARFDAKVLTMATGIQHVHKQCRRAGWVTTGFTMQKTLGEFHGRQ